MVLAEYVQRMIPTNCIDCCGQIKLTKDGSVLLKEMVCTHQN